MDWVVRFMEYGLGSTVYGLWIGYCGLGCTVYVVWIK